MANVLQKNWQDLIKPQKLNIEAGRERDQGTAIHGGGTAWSAASA